MDITEQEKQKASNALNILIEAAELAQSHGVFSIIDSAQVFSAIRYFKPEYGKIEKSEEEKNQDLNKDLDKNK